MCTDLSTIHAPITDLFSRNDPSDTAHQLSQDQLLRFERDGFVAGIRVLDAQQLAALRDDLVPLMNPHHEGSHRWYEYHSNESQDPNTVLFHALGAWRLSPHFHDLLWNKAITVPARQLLKGPVRFWHDQLFCKPARHGGVVAWHQDYSYWTRTQPIAHLSCWIGLDDSTSENGCIHYVPGSHRWPLVPITGLAGDMQAIRAELSDPQWQQFQQAVAVPLKAGECAFHHALTVHGSFENRTEFPRRAVVLNMIRDGVRSCVSEPLLANIPPATAGEPLRGQFFPLLG